MQNVRGREREMMYGNTPQTLIQPANHHSSPFGRWAEQAVPTNKNKVDTDLHLSLSGRTRWIVCKWKAGGTKFLQARFDTNKKCFCVSSVPANICKS